MDTKTRELALPPGWEPTGSRATGVVLAARTGHAGLSGLTAQARLTRRAGVGSLEQWQTLALARASRHTAFDLEDEDAYEVAGHDAAYARYGYRQGDDDLLGEHWAWVIDGVGYLLTATMAREDYADFCDDVEEIAESFRPAA
ncbi:MAG: hypothetical protein V9G04_12310 [Nocardioides sp.]